MNKTQKHKINKDIRFTEVRLVGYFDDPKIMSSYEAFKLAEENQLDLILINENQKPPIVRIDDYNKFIYNLEKIEKEKRRNSSKSTIKEVQLSSEISSNDLHTKIRKGLEFLKEGNKIKCVLKMKGRQNSSPERGKIVMLRYAEGIIEHGMLEYIPKLEGNRWVMMIKPNKK